MRKSAVNRSSGLLSRLLRDQSGNVVAITAAAVLPMLAVIGGSVDMSRIYMTRSRLQAACDAGVLAGRKAMTTAVWTTTGAGNAKQRADAMFNFNFNSSQYDSVSTTFTASANSQGTVNGRATTNLPTVLMKIFGKTSTDIAVDCSADLQVPNIDIVMVLDVTGSMNECPDGSDCDGNSSSKIVALRAAVKNFYSTLKANVPAGSLAQIRLGFVPYSQTVNGSGLFKASPEAVKGELPLSHLADTMQIQSRVANFNTVAVFHPLRNPTIAGTSVDYETYRKAGNIIAPTAAAPSGPSGTPMSLNDCTSNGFAANETFTIDGGPDKDTDWTGNPRGSVVYYQGSTWSSAPPNTFPFQRVTYSLASNHSGQTSSGSDATTFRICTRQRLIETITSADFGYRFTDWTYKPVNFNVSQFKQGNTLNYVSGVNSNYTLDAAGSYDPVQLRALPNQSGLSQSSTTWDGCMEERVTVDANNFAPIPSAARDLNHLVGGTDADTYWRTAAPGLAWLRSGPATETKTGNNGKPGYACPSAKMQNLQVMDQAAVNVYADSLVANGYTYMDVGMIWGLRMVSRQGLFSYRNGAGSSGGQIDRHIIFLTDGVPVSQGNTYSAYAMEDVDRRISGSAGTSVAAGRHAKRFQALCDAQRGAVSIWAIGFGTSITGNLTNCADPNRALQANNTTTLNDAFKRIAKDIADLRLVK